MKHAFSICLSSLHRPYHYVHTSNKINGFQILWSDAPLHFLDMLSFWSGITTTTFQTTFHFYNLLLIQIELLIPKYYHKLLVRRQQRFTIHSYKEKFKTNYNTWNSKRCCFVMEYHCTLLFCFTFKYCCTYNWLSSNSWSHYTCSPSWKTLKAPFDMTASLCWSLFLQSFMVMLIV